MKQILKNVKNNYILFLRLWMAYFLYLLICSGIQYVFGKLSAVENDGIYIKAYYNILQEGNISQFFNIFVTMAKDGFNIVIFNSITIYYILIYLFITIIIICSCSNSKKIYFDNNRFFITVLLLSLINISSLLLMSIKISKETFNNYLENTLLLNCSLKDSCNQKYKILNNIYHKQPKESYAYSIPDYINIKFILITSKKNAYTFPEKSINESQAYESYIKKYGNESDLINFRNISESSN